MMDSDRSWAHIFSTADAVLPGNFIAFVKTAREANEKRYGLPSKETFDYLNKRSLKIVTTKFSHQEFIVTSDAVQICSSQ